MGASIKALAEDLYVNIIGKGQIDRLGDLVANDCFDHAADEMGWENGFFHHIDWFRAIFPNMVIQVNDMVAEDDRVVVYWTMVGTHLGEGAGVAPTGRTITFTAISQLRFRDGKLIEYQVSPDRLGIFQQMGVIPALD
jgi:predicted ester cyclase